MTLFDEEHYFVLGGKPNEIVQNDTKLVFSDLTEISLEEATSGKYRMFQGMFLGTKEQTDDFEQPVGSFLVCSLIFIEYK